MKEKLIEGWPGYSVTDDGRVFSTKYRKKREKRQQVLRHGYPAVSLYKNNRRRLCTVHRLVAEAFVPNPEGKPQVNHKDCAKANNCAENLEWVTPQENTDHALHNGLLRKGRAVVAFSKAGTMMEYPSISMAGRTLGISPGSIHEACSGGRAQAGGYTWMFGEDV